MLHHKVKMVVGNLVVVLEPGPIKVEMDTKMATINVQHDEVDKDFYGFTLDDANIIESNQAPFDFDPYST